MLRALLNWLRDNLISMGLAILLALTVWIVASLEENPPEENDLSTPVQIDVVGLEPGLVITNAYTDTTRVRLRAQRATWRSLSPEDIVVTADLSGLGPGAHQVELNFQIEAQAILVAANPRHIRIELEESYTREMPVQLHLQGQPAIGYSAAAPQLTPTMASIEGPRSQVDLVSEVRASGPIEGLRETLRRDLALTALDSRGNVVEGVTVNPATVSVVVPISQEAGYRDIAILVRTVGRPAPGYYMTGIVTTPQRITVQGDPATINAMQPYAETETIDLTNLTDDLIQEVALDLPPGITPVEAQSVEVLISIAAQLSSRTVLDVPVQAIGLDRGLSATFSPATIDVILSGPLAVLDNLNPVNDILVTADLSDRSPGVYQVTPEVQVVQSDVLVESVLPLVLEATVVTGSSQQEGD